MESPIFFFQQDVATAYSAKTTTNWFAEHDITQLDWLANSPDLNPLENPRGIIKRKMRNTRPNNTDEL